MFKQQKSIFEPVRRKKVYFFINLKKVFYMSTILKKRTD